MKSIIKAVAFSLTLCAGSASANVANPLNAFALGAEQLKKNDLTQKFLKANPQLAKVITDLEQDMLPLKGKIEGYIKAQNIVECYNLLMPLYLKAAKVLLAIDNKNISLTGIPAFGNVPQEKLSALVTFYKTLLQQAVTFIEKAQVPKTNEEVVALFSSFKSSLAGA